MKTMATARAIGGSVVVTIPREIVIEAQIKPGEIIELDVSKAKKSFFGIAKTGSFTKEDELNTHD